MIATLILAAGILGFTELPPQAPQPGQCRTFLWLKEEPPLRFAMLDETARQLRLQRQQKAVILPETAPGVYEGEGYRVTVQVHYADGAIPDGAIVDSGSIRIESLAGGDSMSFAAGGLRNCP